MILQSDSALIEGEVIEDCWIEIDGVRISQIVSGIHPSPDKSVHGTLIPAFIDIHCHGGGGSYFSQNPEGVIAFHRKHGTSSIIASLVSEPFDRLAEQIAFLMPFYRSGEIAGIHLEGPYLSPLRAGAHAPQYLTNPVWNQLEKLIEIGQGAIKMVTLAPELEGAIESIRELKTRGVIAAIGHTAATRMQMGEAISAGASLITHFTNGMVKLDEDRSITDYILQSENLAIEIILDGIHVTHSDVSEILTIDSSRIILVTDAMSAAGNPDGSYRIGDLEVDVEDGVARLKSGALAGSTLTMDEAFARLVRDYGVTINSAVAATSTNAARYLSIEDRGVIKVGAIADFLEWDGHKVRTL